MDRLPALGTPTALLNQAEFQQLSEVAPALEWFANIDNPNTRRAYQSDLQGFMAFVGVQAPEQLRQVTRAHVIAWRTSLEARGLASATIRRKLAALASLFDHLCECNAVVLNPVQGTKRPKIENPGEGRTPALGDHQARALLDAPDEQTLKGRRDRAILSVLLYHGLRRAELCRLRIEDVQMRRGVNHLRVHGKGSKLRYVPLHPATARRLDDYLLDAGHADEMSAPLFLSLDRASPGQGISPDGVYKVLAGYLRSLQLDSQGFGPHAMRATAATNALENEADIAKVQAWLGHANISTTRLYDRREMRPEDSPTFKVSY